MFCTSEQVGAKVQKLWDSAVSAQLKADTLLLLSISKTDLTEPLLLTMSKIRLQFSKELLRRKKATLGDLDVPAEVPTTQPTLPVLRGSFTGAHHPFPHLPWSRR